MRAPEGGLTDILVNTRRAHGHPGLEDLRDAKLAEARAWLTGATLLAEGRSDAGCA